MFDIVSLRGQLYSPFDADWKRWASHGDLHSRAQVGGRGSGARCARPVPWSMPLALKGEAYIIDEQGHEVEAVFKQLFLIIFYLFFLILSYFYSF